MAIVGRLWRVVLLAAGASALSTWGFRESAQEALQPPIQQHVGAKSPLDEEFAKFVAETLDQFKVPGLSIAVIDGDSVYAEGYGFATLPDTPATPETLWYGGSTTKAFTGATLASMIDSKRYPALSQGWSTPISSIIRDDFVLQDTWATSHLTLEDAISHRTGMPRHDLSTVREIDGKPAHVRDQVRLLRHLPYMNEPRTKFRYCNLMFYVLSHVIETLTGDWLGDTIRSTIWEPLGMNATFFDVPSAIRAPEDFATGYYWDKDNETYVEVSVMTMVEVSGAGAIISNVLDYAKWIKLLFSEGDLFSSNVHKDIRESRMIVNADEPVVTYSLGWMRQDYHGHKVYTHNGGVHAFGADVYWLPDDNYGVVAFGNTADTSNQAEEVLVWKLIRDKLGISDDAQHQNKQKGDSRLDTSDLPTGDVKGSMRKTFPNLPDPPLPPTFNMSAFEGTYTDAGCGPMPLQVECGGTTDMPFGCTLVAYRPEMTWRYEMRLHHASGEYWLAYFRMMDNPVGFHSFAAAEFKIGPEGEPDALEVVFQNEGTGEYEGTVVFKREPES